MSRRCNRVASSPLILLVVAVALLASVPLVRAFEAKRETDRLQQKIYFRPDLYISSSNVPLDLSTLRQRAGDSAVSRFLDEYGTDFNFFMDPRSGALTSIIGRVPMVPGSGKGNRLTLKDLELKIGRPVPSVDDRVVADLVKRFVVEHAELIGVSTDQLGAAHAARVTDGLWQVYIPQEVAGIPVRHGRLVATLRHGNLVLLGTETWGHVSLDTRPTVKAEQALAAGFAYAGGRAPVDEVWKKPTLEIVPYAPQEHQSGNAFSGPVGSGYGHRLVWSFGFRRSPGLEAWETLVDAHSGEILSFEDTSLYAEEQIVGGVYPLTSTEICPTDETCGTLQPGYPMPFAYTGLPAPNDVTNSAGLFDFTGGTVTTSLTGPYVDISDTCGPVDESSTLGGLDLGGVNGDHDCTASGSSPGNTSASRSCFYELNKVIELARGWLPNNTWLQQPLSANVNINNTCNAVYSFGSVNFYKSGAGCRNTGELAAVFDHEWGHGLDDNDAGGSLSTSSEAYADIAAIYRLHASCVGHGFWFTADNGCGQTSDGTGFNGNESRSGTHCDTDCSGVRDADWALHEDATPDTPQNFSCVHCQTTSGGPCGGQVHCDAAPSRQAAWDFVARDLRGAPFDYDENTAFIVGNKLFYQGSGNIGSWHTCTCPDTSGGCGATNAYLQWLAADDDNGDLNDGTPHMTALYAAFDRHNIACEAPAPVNGGCAGGPVAAPIDVQVSIGSHQLTVSWGAVPGAEAYRVFRTEGHAGCNFGKALIATVPETSFVDTQVANNRPYSYVIQAVGSSDACYGPVSTCVTETPQPCAGTVALDRGVYRCSDDAGITLVDSDLRGAGSYEVVAFSSADPLGETVSLVESPSGSGRFAGTVPLSATATTVGDGIVFVTDGGSVGVRYMDTSACGIPDVAVEQTAPVDCTGPQISAVQVAEIGGRSALVSWTTSEPSDGTVLFGSAPPPGQQRSDEAFTTAHEIRIDGLSQCSNYVLQVSSTDVAGNTVVDDNRGDYYTFETGVDNQPEFVSTDTPIAIPDNDLGGATSTVAVSEDDLVLDVDVRVNVTHTYTGDLTLSLIAPDSTTVVLANRRGGGGNDFIDTLFDDEAATAVADGSPPFTGSFRPEQPLGVLDGTGLVGDWRLKVVDQAGIDLGVIESWSLIVTLPARQCGAVADFVSYRIEQEACSTGSAGLGNDRWETGEKIQFSVTVENSGTEPLTDAVVHVTPTTPGVVMIDDTARVGRIEPGGAADTLAPHLIAQLDSSLTCGQTLQFDVATTSGEGNWNGSFQQTVGEIVDARTDRVLDEDFLGGIPATWTIVDGSTDGQTWFADDASDPSGCASPDPQVPVGGRWAAIDSSCTGGGDRMDEQLVTPSMDLTGTAAVTLRFDHWFEWSPQRRNEVADVDVRSSRTAGEWINVARFTGVSTANSQRETIDITSQAGDAPDVEVRWHYYEAQNEAYWYVDNVIVEGFVPQGCLDVTCAAPSSPPPSIPDGSSGGAAMRADRGVADGSEIVVTWDAQCSPVSAKVLYGPLDQIADYGVSGALCDATTPATWSSVPGGSLWFVVVAADGAGVESSWGQATDGERSGLSASDTCGDLVKEVSGTCP